MAKIIQRKSLGVKPVYDIGVCQDHNFVLANGLVASNCFNKSHSAAYAYVTFQTAYLKANYPVEYMAALLSVNSGQKDKVQKYIANCVTMGIEVEPPDINRSGLDFTPTDKRILFGLSAIQNLGQGAIESILKSRDQDGPFKSLADLCDRLDSRTANKRALEALIHSGSLDTLEPNANRKQLVADLEFVMDWAQARAKDREIGQGNLFDLLGGLDGGATDSNSGFDAVPKAPLTADYPQEERLKLEKELLGFYVSDHPLKGVQQATRVLAPINLGDLSECDERSTLSAIVMVTGLKPVTTKKGDRMAILQIEDLSGQTEAVVFPKSFERIGHHLQVDARLMLWGKIDRRDEQVQFIVDDAEPVDDIRLVMVELEARQAGDLQYQHQLREILKGQRGDDEKAAKVPVVAIVKGFGKRHLVRLGGQFRVKDPQATVEALKAKQFEAHAEALISKQKEHLSAS